MTHSMHQIYLLKYIIIIKIIVIIINKQINIINEPNLFRFFWNFKADSYTRVLHLCSIALERFFWFRSYSFISYAFNPVNGVSDSFVGWMDKNLSVWNLVGLP